MAGTVSAVHANGGMTHLMVDTKNAMDGLRLHGGTNLTNELTTSANNGLASPVTTTRSHRSDTASEIPSFMVSAPGKVIVYGEHAVVHGKVRGAPLQFFNRGIAEERG